MKSMSNLSQFQIHALLHVISLWLVFDVNLTHKYIRTQREAEIIGAAALSLQ